MKVGFMIFKQFWPEYEIAVWEVQTRDQQLKESPYIYFLCNEFRRAGCFFVYYKFRSSSRLLGKGSMNLGNVNAMCTTSGYIYPYVLSNHSWNLKFGKYYILVYNFNTKTIPFGKKAAYIGKVCFIYRYNKICSLINTEFFVYFCSFNSILSYFIFKFQV